jgi:uncharacterized BrkB/YihY/UPF0761 family membrane protein
MWRGRLFGLAWLLVFVIGVVGTGTLLSIATSHGMALRAAGLVLAIAIDVAVVATAFRFLPSDGPSWREVLPGAILAGLLWAVLQTAGSWIVTRQIQGASDVYGFFALVIGLLSWVYLTAETILIGAETNVVLRRRLWPRSLVPPPPTRADLAVEERAREEHALAGDRLDAQAR